MQIFRSILDTRAELRARKEELTTRARGVEARGLGTYGSKGLGELCERTLDARVVERGEEEEEARRELQDLVEVQNSTGEVEARLAKNLEEQSKRQVQVAVSTNSLLVLGEENERCSRSTGGASETFGAAGYCHGFCAEREVS